jgi:arylsulfatase A-like enzyme
MKPNIVILLADQWRASATGYAGDPNVKTPALDRLAREGIWFRNAVSVCPVCTPYRAALMTGRWPTSTGMFLNDLHLPDRELCMAEILKRTGYATAYIGKWHLDGHGRDSYIPPERRQGWEYWKAAECDHSYNHSHYYAGTSNEKKFWDGYDAFAQTKDAREYIRQRARQGQPFALVVAYGPPHFSHKTAPQSYKDLYPPEKIRLPPNVPETMRAEAQRESQGYYAHCSALDRCVADVLGVLSQTGLEGKTIVVFTADHGEMMGSHGCPPSMKQQPWDEAAHVPFLLRYPTAHGGRGRTVQTPLTTPDILPTLLGLAGVVIPATIEGEDLSPLIRGGQEQPDRAALYMGVAPFAGSGFNKEYRAIRTSRYTYVRGLQGPWLMFDDEKDPYQVRNLAAAPEFAALCRQFDDRLQASLRKIGDSFSPAAYYIKQWNLKVALGESISYAPGARPQTPQQR